jgi:predicted flap endonuclease-1-like 5' DNA nuclease
MNIRQIEGIGEVSAAKLEELGIKTIAGLLKAGASRAERAKLAEASGLSEHKILEWVNRADLQRIKGIGEEYSDLLEASGVDTVKELKQRKAENLHAKMIEVNAEKNLVRRVPTLTEVTSWVEQAGNMEAMVTH